MFSRKTLRFCLHRALHNYLLTSTPVTKPALKHTSLISVYVGFSTAYNGTTSNYYNSSNNRGSRVNIFSYFCMKTLCCGLSLEVPCRGLLREHYPEYIFLRRNKNDIHTFLLKNNNKKKKQKKNPVAMFL